MDFRKTEEQELLLESIDEFFASGEFDESYIQRCEAEQKPLKEFRLARSRPASACSAYPRSSAGSR